MKILKRLGYELTHCWKNPIWYFCLILFVFGPVISKNGWNPLEWGYWWIYVIAIPVLIMLVSILDLVSKKD
jgi:hypothetical protein